MAFAPSRQNWALPPNAGGGVVADKGPIERAPYLAAALANATSGAALCRPPAAAQQRTMVSSHPGPGCLRIPLRECARSRNDDGAHARYLLDAGAQTEDTDRAGRTALHWAAARGNTDVVHALLEAGANINARDGAGSSPLHCAARAGHAAIVEALLGCSWAYPSRQNRITAAVAPTGYALASDAKLNVSAEKEEAEVESMVDARNYYGSTALHRAAFNGREEALLALLNGGAGVDVMGRSGRSALHLACRNAHPGCVEILLAAGAFESARAKDGSTPWSELADAAEDRRPGDEKVEKVATLLRHSQGLRAWGRRGWLVMLKASRDRQHTKCFAELMAESSSVQVALREKRMPQEAGNLCSTQGWGRGGGRADCGFGGPRICVAHAAGDEME
ncbi:unnamed protein product, partial [Sphacelaria rigidula]